MIGGWTWNSQQPPTRWRWITRIGSAVATCTWTH